MDRISVRVVVLLLTSKGKEQKSIMPFQEEKKSKMSQMYFSTRTEAISYHTAIDHSAQTSLGPLPLF